MGKPFNKIKLWLAAKTEACNKVLPLFSDSLERKLSLYEKFRMKLHLAMCSACVNYVSNLAFMHDALAAREDCHAHGKPLDVLPSEARERLKLKLRNVK